jgi:hypothetical protein
MNTQSTYPQKPTLVSAIAWMTLAAGIVNIFWGLAASGLALATIVGICCMPITILPSILGIFEILYAAKLLSNPPQPVQPAKTIAVLEIVCILAGNVFAMIVGILSLVFYNDQIVKDYFARLNGNLPPEPVAPDSPQIPPVVPVPPATTEEPIPSPITGEEPTPLKESPVPETPAPPASMDETIVSSFQREDPRAAEPPVSPEEPDPSAKPTEE